MNKNENNALVKTIFKCGLQLFLVAASVALMVGLWKLGVHYSENLWSGILFFNNLFLPSKHFIQNNIWYFIGSWSILTLWLICVFFKTPKEHIQSCRLLIKTFAVFIAIATVLSICIADMSSDGIAILFSFITIFIPLFGSFLVSDLLGDVKKNEFRMSK